MTTSPHAPSSGPQFNNAVIRWIEYRLPVFSFADNFMGSGYPAPRNLSYWWNFGSLAGIGGCVVAHWSKAAWESSTFTSALIVACPKPQSSVQTSVRSCPGTTFGVM